MIDNAVKYSEGGGAVRIAAQGGGDSIAISVADRGIGIAQRDLERIFE